MPLIPTPSCTTRGLTLIEVVIGMALLGVLALLAVTGFKALRAGADVNTASRQIVAILQLARNRTLASVGDISYGVHFAADTYALFPGTAYDAGNSDNEVHTVHPELEIYAIALGGGDDVIFNRVDGTTTNAGSLGVRSIAEPSNARTITIADSGLVGAAGSVNPTDTRVTDTRHGHFDLGRSIQGASTLTLVFSDPPDSDVVENIAMADYFNADQSEFDWEGTISVTGSGQVLRIHTHTLTALNTILSVHRDRRYNTKALTIYIDDEEIVSYDATGEATVGAGGGTLTIQ